jgi:hypothetical protein
MSKMSKIRFLIFCVCTLISIGQLCAQEDTLIYSYEAHRPDSTFSRDTTPPAPGTVKYYYSSELDSLFEFQKNINIKNCPKTVKGFRVQIYSCSGVNCQQKAEKNYNQFLIAHPEIPAEKIWDPPSYKVRVGNCRNRFDAERIKSEIKEDFPFIFIVPDFIDSPFKADCKSLN